MTAYPRLLSEWKLRNTTLKNRVVFAPTCPSWVADPRAARIIDIGPSYYEERASGGVGLIIIGGTHVTEDSIAAPLAQPGLWEDGQIEGFARVADACHRHGAKVAVQLRHTGLRGFTSFKQEPTYDFDATWHTFGPSQVPLGEFAGGQAPKEMTNEEIETVLDAHATAAARAMAAGLDGIEFHMSHGYMSWQFLSPLYNKRTDRWGGSYENRLRFAVEAMRRMREAIGDEPFLGYRINSTSFWPGDLELEDVVQIVQDIERRVDIDFVDVSCGVHHQFIHSPMEFEPGWEKGYSRAIREVSTKPVFVVGRITNPEVAEQLLENGDGDAVALARQLFADPDWVLKSAEGRADDIRRCVAANHCWRSVMRGGRVQCVYNPTVGREAKWGKHGDVRAAEPKRALVIGGGPAGLEYARIAAARGHDVLVLEAEDEVGGHVRLQSLLVSRRNYGDIAHWLAGQAAKNGAEIRTASPVTADNLDEVLATERPDHVVVATGSRWASDGFQGWTAAPLPGWESGNCVAWTDVATGTVTPGGDVVVIDDVCDVIAPLTAVGIAAAGAAKVRLVTRWPMVGMETIADAYLEWILPKLYEHEVELVTDRFVREIDGATVKLYNLYRPADERTVPADWIVMATARRSENALHELIRSRGTSVETIGDAIAPRGTYEAVFEGHRQARKL